MAGHQSLFGLRMRAPRQFFNWSSLTVLLLGVPLHTLILVQKPAEVIDEQEFISWVWPGTFVDEGIGRAFILIDARFHVLCSQSRIATVSRSYKRVEKLRRKLI